MLDKFLFVSARIGYTFNSTIFLEYLTKQNELRWYQDAPITMYFFFEFGKAA
jgi:hypothetical protein